MKSVLLIAQALVSVLLVVCILLQAKGTGLGSTFGGSGEMYSTKRGVERIVFIGTIVLVVLFGILGIALLI